MSSDGPTSPPQHQGRGGLGDSLVEDDVTYFGQGTRKRMRLPGFVILAGVIIAAVVAFLIPVHDNFGVRCPSPGAVGAIQADANGYATPDVSLPATDGVDTSAFNAQIQAEEDAVITSKVRACHDGGQTRLIIAGAVLLVAIIGSRFVPDVRQRRDVPAS